MAYTKIHSIKSTVGKAINYITNPEKTDGELLVSGYNCESMSAAIDFKITEMLAQEVMGKDYTKVGGANNLAYHTIQSFSKFDKLTPEEAHEIGKKLADEMLQGKHEYIIATHIDKGHIHNHIIFNSVSFYDYGKYRTAPYKTARKIREISDKLCEEKGLNIIKEPKGKGKSRTEWEARKQGTSWKAKIEFIINENINKAKDYNEFILLLKNSGVEVKEGKHIAFKLEGQQKFVRGKTIGIDFTKEKIVERILNGEKVPDKNSSKDNVTTPEKFEKKIEQAAKKQLFKDTKELANALIVIRRESINNVIDFDIKASELKAKSIEVKTDIKTLDNKNMQYKEAAKYLVAYNKYLPVKLEYDKQNFISKQKFYKKNESELLAFEHAEKQLEKIGVNTNVDYNKVVELVKQQTEKTGELNKLFIDTEKRINEITKAKNLVENILNPNLKTSELELERNKQDKVKETER